MKGVICSKCGSQDTSAIFVNGKNQLECNDCTHKWEKISNEGGQK